MELGLVRKIDIDHEMQQAYLDYAMSVIVARALPDARDGLKPVQRRILYAMYDMGLRADSTYKKSARIVGEVLGKYHPHGDSAVYEAMARMAQDFSLRTMLVDGQGNFGSVDGDPPAAMRYTEARLALPALDLLADINKNTVEFTANFDETLTEPSVLPASLPNLLVNGATGIAVGMATSIPPHNLGEITDALVYMLENWDQIDDISVDQLMDFVQGPDFPTGGVIIQEAGEDGIEAAYGSGRGKVTIQARAHLEEMERGKNRIIVTELPYQTNKSSLIERIAELAREGGLEGISDLRDESDRQGMRIVIELSKAADPDAILRELYKRTPMQSTFSIILLALVDNEPRMLTLKQALKVYIEHRLTVIKRRSEFDLERAKARAHILEGYLIALKNLDEIIALIKNSPDVESARERLMKRYKLSDLQANAILEMQLRRLAALERRKIENEYKEILAFIKDLETLLKSPKRIRNVAAEELLRVKADYADKRRTHIVSLKAGATKRTVLSAAELLPEQEVWVSMNLDGKICRTHDDRPPRLSGTDAPKLLQRAQTTDTLYLVSGRGMAAAVAVHTLPEGDKASDGTPFNKVCALKTEDKPVAIFVLPAKKSSLPEGTCILTVTKGGMVKKSPISELPGPAAQTFWLAKVSDGDALGWVAMTDGKKELLLASAKGMAIRFNEEEVRPMGLVAAGVNGIKLGVGDEVVGARILPAKGEVFLVSTDGKGRRVDISDFPVQGRYGKGVIGWEMPKGTRLAGIAIGKPNTQVTIHLLKAASKMVRLDDAPLRKRSATRGEEIVEVKPGDAVIGLTISIESDEKKSDKKDAKPEKKEMAAQLELMKTPPLKPIAGKAAISTNDKKGSGTKTAAAPKKTSGKTPAATKPVTNKKAAETKTVKIKEPAAKKTASVKKPVEKPKAAAAKKSTVSEKKTATTTKPAAGKTTTKARPPAGKSAPAKSVPAKAPAKPAAKSKTTKK